MREKTNEHDRMAGAPLPIPTRIASNEECLTAAPQMPEQRNVGLAFKERPAQRRRPPEPSRREFLAGSCAMATAFMAISGVLAPRFRVHAAQAHDLLAYPELWPKTPSIDDA